MTTLNLQVSAAGDDAYVYGGTTVLESATPYGMYGNWEGSAPFGARFLSVTVPGGSTISTAAMSVYCHLTMSTPGCHIKCTCDAADNSAAFTDGTNFLGRTRTTGTTWDPSAQTADNWYSCSDISTEIDAVVSRAGWASGNALTVFFDDNASSADTRRMNKMYVYDTTLCAKLDITYTAGGGASPLLRLNPIDGLGAKLRGL